MLSARHRRLWALLALCLVALLSACAPQTAPLESPLATPEPAPGSPQPASPTPEGAPTTQPARPTAPASPTAAPTASPGPARLTPVVPAAPLPVPTSAQKPAAGEVPQALLEAIYQDAVRRTGVPRAQITLLRAEAVTWRDGSLGCPQPGMEYTQALVPGYWVVLDVDGQELSYHASERGTFVLCESTLPPQDPLPRGDR